MKKASVKPQSQRNIVHDDWKLRKASDYLEFDVHTFAAGIDIFSKYKGTEIGNAALDSLLVRARLLIDFFCRDEAYSDDVIALDFFHDFSTKPYKPKMPKYLKVERGKINKRLMHMTTKPMPYLRSNQRYSVKKISKPIVRAFRKWLSVVPDSRLQKPAKRSKEIFEKHLKRIEKLVP
jgi:hypothetical protein